MHLLFLFLLLPFFLGESNAEITKVCQIPNVQTRGDAKPGDFVFAEEGGLMKYACLNENKETRCIDGEWTPEIEDKCVNKDCENQDGETVSNGTSTNYKCREVTIFTECINGVWSRGINCSPPKCNNETVRQNNYAEMAIPFLPVRLSGSISSFALCTKGTMVSAIKADKKFTGEHYGKWYSLNGRIYSGIHILCSEDPKILPPRENYLDCIDIDECRLLRGSRNIIEVPINDEEHSGVGLEASIVGQEAERDGSQGDQDDTETVTLKDLDIIPCPGKAVCKNVADNQRYKCDCHRRFVGNATFCDSVACPEIEEKPHRKVSVDMGRNFARFYCNNEAFEIDKTDLGIPNTKFKCVRGNWTSQHTGKQDPLPECKINENYCGPPDPLDNGRMTVGDKYTKDAQVQYFCKNDYFLQGPKIRTCRSGGYWDQYQPVCHEYIPIVDETIAIKKETIDKYDDFSDSTYTLQQGSVRERTHVGDYHGVNLALIIDRSSSIGHEENMEKAKRLCELIVKELFASDKKDSVRVGVYSFGGDFKTDLSFINDTTRNNDATEVIKVINGIKFTGGGSPLNKALNKFGFEEATLKAIERKQILMLLTDGFVNEEEDRIESRINRFKAKGWETFVITGARSYNYKNMKKWASSPSHIHILHSWEKVIDIADKLIETKKKNELCGFAGNTTTDGGGLSIYIEGEREAAREGTYPWLVSIFPQGKYDYEHFLGAGSLICDRWIITTKQVLIKNQTSGDLWQADELVVETGVHYLNKKTAAQQTEKTASQQTANVESITSHPDFNVALIKLGSTVNMTEYVRTICVLEKNGKIFSEDFHLDIQSKLEGTFIGWGSYPPHVKTKTHNKFPLQACEKGPQTTTVQPIDFTLPDLDNEDDPEDDANDEKEKKQEEEEIARKKERDEKIANRTLCGGGPYDVCLKDQGGPFMMSIQDEHQAIRFVLTGIATPTDDCVYNKQNNENSEFISIIGLEEWIHNTTNMCNTGYHNDGYQN